MLDHTNKSLNLEAKATLDPTIEFHNPCQKIAEIPSQFS